MIALCKADFPPLSISAESSKESLASPRENIKETDNFKIIKNLAQIERGLFRGSTALRGFFLGKECENGHFARHRGSVNALLHNVIYINNSVFCIMHSALKLAVGLEVVLVRLNHLLKD